VEKGFNAKDVCVRGEMCIKKNKSVEKSLKLVNTFEDIIKSIKNIGTKYLEENIGDKRDYYYLEKKFLEEYLELEYKLIILDEAVINKVNKYLETSYENTDVSFRLDLGSRRAVLNNTNFNKLFRDEDKALLKAKKTRLNDVKDLVNDYILYDALINSKSDNNICNIQLKNLVLSYIDYCFTFEESEQLNIKGFVHHDYKHSSDTLDTNSSKKIDSLRIRLEKISEHTFIYKTKIDSKDALKLFIEKASEHKSDEVVTFYRGQSNSDWKLTPSIARNQQQLVREDEMFYEILSLRPNDFANESTDYEKLITMQHYGLPTRLLDLTRNPLMSLYFACNTNDENDGVIQVFNIMPKNIMKFEDRRLDCLMKIVKHPNCDFCSSCDKKLSSECSIEKTLFESHVVKGIAKNPRITNQSGDFIFVGKGRNNKCCKVTQKPIKKIIIDKDAKADIRIDLEMMNIHGGTVYPDLTNMAKYLKKRYIKGKRNEAETHLDKKANDNENPKTVKKEKNTSRKIDIVKDVKEVKVKQLMNNKLLVSSDKIKEYLLEFDLEDKEIDEVLETYDNGTDIKYAKDMIDDLLKQKRYRASSRFSILANIEFDFELSKFYKILRFFETSHSQQEFDLFIEDTFNDYIYLLDNKQFEMVINRMQEPHNVDKYSTKTQTLISRILNDYSWSVYTKYYWGLLLCNLLENNVQLDNHLVNVCVKKEILDYDGYHNLCPFQSNPEKMISKKYNPDDDVPF
jgi:hypothetical protein